MVHTAYIYRGCSKNIGS